MEEETVQNIWHHLRCKDMLRGRHIIEIDSEASIAEGCDTLVSHGISSAPVWDRTTQSYAGMLDYRDIVDFVLLVFHRKRHLDPISENDATVGIREIVHSATTGQRVPAKAVSDLSHKNPFYSVMAESPLMAAVDILAADNGVHRLNVVCADGRVKGILSQTDIIRLLVSKGALFSDVLDRTLAELKMSRAPTATVSEDSSVLEAMQKMSDYGISSVAVIDSCNTLLGNISMADIRFIFQHGNYHRLWVPCSRFLSMTLSQKGLENDGRDKFPVFDVYETSTLLYTMQKLLATRTHHMWVIDQERKLIGVVSNTDILRAVVSKTANASA